MKKTILMFLLLPLFWFSQSCDDPKNANKFNNETTVDVMGLHFITTASEAGHTEIKASKVAESISQNPSVVAFAKMMITDHSAAGTKLDKLEDKELVHIPYTLNEDHLKMIDSLSKLSGSNFDKTYMQVMVNDHENAVDLFKEASENRDGAVRSYAAETLPVIEMHLNSAKTILASLK
jgi:putative membrane protein